MIKQFILTLEADNEIIINHFVDIMNKQSKAIAASSPIKIFIEVAK